MSPASRTVPVEALRPAVRPALRSPLLLLLLLWPPLALGVGPFERNHPRAEEGLEALEAGRYEDALRAFEAARAELPGHPALDYDRAQVLARMGRLEEAKALFGRLSRSGPPALQQKAAYNLGNVHAQLSERKEAVSAYRRALALDPSDADARHNLEVVLRNLEPPEPPAPDGGVPDGGAEDGGPPTDGGTPDAGRSDGGGGGTDGGEDGGAGDGGPASLGDGGLDGGAGDGGPGDAGPGDAGRGDGGPGDGGQGQPGEDDAPDGGAGDESPDGGPSGEPHQGRDIQPGDAGVPAGALTPDEAERLLDSLKQNERNLQLWRFQRRKEPTNDQKDW